MSSSRYTMFCAIVVGSLFASSLACFGQETSAICKFDSGPKAGEIQEQPPLPVGAACQDSAGSTGKVVPGGIPKTRKAGSTPGAPVHSKQTGVICKFESGPKAGQTQEQPPLPLGSPCQDNEGSTGKVVPGGPPSNPAPSAPSKVTGTVCKFEMGPKAGQTQIQPPLPLGSPCQDNEGSTGKVVPGNTLPPASPELKKKQM